MNFNNKPQDIEALPSEYQEFYHNRSAAGNRRIKSEVIRFIRSGWFGILTDINPVALEEKLLAEEKGMELHEYHLAISGQERRRNKSYQGLQQYAVHP